MCKSLLHLSCIYTCCVVTAGWPAAWRGGEVRFKSLASGKVRAKRRTSMISNSSSSASFENRPATTTTTSKRGTHPSRSGIRRSYGSICARRLDTRLYLDGRHARHDFHHSRPSTCFQHICRQTLIFDPSFRETPSSPRSSGTNTAITLDSGLIFS